MNFNSSQFSMVIYDHYGTSLDGRVLAPYVEGWGLELLPGLIKLIKYVATTCSFTKHLAFTNETHEILLKRLKN